MKARMFWNDLGGPGVYAYKKGRVGRVPHETLPLTEPYEPN